MLPILLLFLSLDAHAQDEPQSFLGVDYHWANTDWNGLSELFGAQQQVGRALDFDPALDLASLSTDRALALIYPLIDLPVPDIIAFLNAGGRLLLADDFGASDPLLHALGIDRMSGPIPHDTFLRDNEALPVLTARSEHPIVLGVRRVVANHPQALVSDVEPVLAYDRPSFGLVYELEVGAGRAIVLGDPSLLVNFMLDAADNRALAMNLFQRLCESRDECAVSVLTGSRGALLGHFPEPPGEATLGEALTDVFDRSFTAVNELLGELGELRPSRRGMFFASILLGIGVAAFLFSAVPLVRPRWLSFSLRPSPWLRSRSEYEWNLERLLRAGRDGDYRLPLAILKEEFEDLFLTELAQHAGELEPERRHAADQVERFARRYAERVVPDGKPARRAAAAARAHAMLRELARIPAANSLVGALDGRYSERLLRRLYGEARGLLTELGIWERYERRTGRP